MGQAKKFNVSEIDVRHVEYLPTISSTPKKDVVTLSQAANYDESGNFNIILSDLGSFALKAGMAYFSGGIYLLRYTKTFMAIAIDLKNMNFNSILKRTFKNVSYAPKIKMVHKLIEEKQDERALLLLEEILVDLETIDDFDMRSSLNILRAKLHFKNRRYLASAIYYMEAATLTSCQKLQKMGEGADQSLVNKTGMLYLISLQSLGLYLKENEVDENFNYWVSDLAKRAKTLLEKEAQYREVDKFHFTKAGEISLGIIKLPYPTIYKDEKSASINRKLALEAEKVKCLIEKRQLVRNLPNYLKEKLYLKDDVDFLLEVAEQVSTSDEINFHECGDFFDHLHKVMGSSSDYNDCLAHIDILKIQMKIKYGEAKETDVLMLFRLLDNDAKNETSFLHILAIADKISTQCSHETRKEMATLMLEKDYPFLTNEHRECYRKIAEAGFNSDNPEINCLYPSNVLQLRENLSKLEVKDHAVIYKGQVEILSHENFKEIIVKKSKKLFPEENFNDYGHLLTKNKVNKIYESDDILGIASNLIQDLHLEENLKGIRERIKNEKVRIGVFGLTKVGKSTFLNTLVGKELLKSDRGVATNIPTYIKKGTLDQGTVFFLDNSKEIITLDKIPEFTSEQYNPQNKKNVSRVEINLNCTLPGGLEVVDIPGFGVNESNYHLHLEIIENCIGMVDAVFLITTPTDGLKSFEMEFIKKVTMKKKLPFVLIGNKMDELDENEALDLKQGLNEKLKKNGIETDSFLTFFVSAQMGLSFIDGVDKSRFFNMSREDAQLESGLHKVKESLWMIGEKIHSQKEISIVKLLKSEAEKHKHDMVELMNDTELVQKSSADDVLKQISMLKTRLSDFQLHIDNNLVKYQVSLTRLESIDVEIMATRLFGRVDFSKMTDKKEDFAAAEPGCNDIFKEETKSILKLMEEPLENCLECLNKYSSVFRVELLEMQQSTPSRVYASVNESGVGQIGYILEKLIYSQKTILNECKRILSDLKLNEIFYRKNKFQEVQRHYLHVQQHINDRVKNMENALNFNEKEFQDKTTYYLKQIELADLHLKTLSQSKRE